MLGAKKGSTRKKSSVLSPRVGADGATISMRISAARPMTADGSQFQSAPITTGRLTSLLNRRNPSKTASLCLEVSPSPVNKYADKTKIPPGGPACTWHACMRPSAKEAAKVLGKSQGHCWTPMKLLHAMLTPALGPPRACNRSDCCHAKALGPAR